jgi:hypothetical protein
MEGGRSLPQISILIFVLSLSGLSNFNGAEPCAGMAGAPRGETAGYAGSDQCAAMAGDTKRFPAALAEEYTVVDAQMLDHSLTAYSLGLANEVVLT